MNTDTQKILGNKILLLQKYMKKLAAYLVNADDELLHNEDKFLLVD